MTDSTNGNEYAIMGLTTGTAFVDVTDPVNPVYLGHPPLPAGVGGSSWRDIKVFADHAYIGSEAPGSGLQVMNLAQLRNVPAPPQVNIINPPDGSTDLSGTLQVQIDASDTEDADGTLDVDWKVGSGAGSIKGTVYADGGSKISGVTVEVQGGSSATTNKGGKYNLQNVAAGTRTVTAWKTGYAPQTKLVPVNAGVTVTVNFTLAPM